MIKIGNLVSCSLALYVLMHANNAWVDTHTHTYTHTHTHTDTYMYTYMYTYVPVCYHK